MSYANGTTNYNLPQTVGTDKRDWFDTNNAFEDVDADLHEAVTKARESATDITTLSGRVSDVETEQSSQGQDIVDIKATQETQGTAITSLGNKIDDVEDDCLDMICAVDEGTAQVATVAVTTGHYFRYNNVLYMATADIAIGDTIVPNTNCRATNVATELESAPTPSSPTAEDVSYDNTSSGLTADDVQEAVDEIAANLTADNNQQFKFAYDNTSQKYGYIVESGGADTFVPFSTGGHDEVVGNYPVSSSAYSFKVENARYASGIVAPQTTTHISLTWSADSWTYKARTDGVYCVDGTSGTYTANQTLVTGGNNSNHYVSWSPEDN